MIGGKNVARVGGPDGDSSNGRRVFTPIACRKMYRECMLGVDDDKWLYKE